MQLNSHSQKFFDSEYSYLKSKMRDKIIRTIPEQIRDEISETFFNGTVFISGECPINDDIELKEEWRPYATTILKLVKSLVNEWEYLRLATYQQVINNGPSTQQDLEEVGKIHENYKKAFWKVINWI